MKVLSIFWNTIHRDFFTKSQVSDPLWKKVYDVLIREAISPQLPISLLFLFVSGGDNVHLKILVPSIAAGAIIGKGGETIAQVQKEAGARVKMSKANDFYPGK